jgi:hypothetical protein
VQAQRRQLSRFEARDQPGVDGQGIERFVSGRLVRQVDGLEAHGLQRGRGLLTLGADQRQQGTLGQPELRHEAGHAIQLRVQASGGGRHAQQQALGLTGLQLQRQLEAQGARLQLEARLLRLLGTHAQAQLGLTAFAGPALQRRFERPDRCGLRAAYQEPGQPEPETTHFSVCSSAITAHDVTSCGRSSHQALDSVLAQLPSAACSDNSLLTSSARQLRVWPLPSTKLGSP